MGAMNATDAAGLYIFGGSQGKSQPFTQVDGRYIYQGDTGDSAARNIQVDHSRVIDVGNHGGDVFLRSAPGAMTFIHGGSAHNTGIAVVGSMQIHAPKKASQVQRMKKQNEGDPEAGWKVQVNNLDEPTAS